ncbi:MAG: AGE family epimerase/isomerase [Mucilaginibacter sp.]
MRLTKLHFLKLALTICVLACCLLSFQQTGSTEKAAIAAQMKTSMVDQLLKPWYPKAIDEQYGGFLSAFTYDFKPTGNQDKMIVTQARHVWSNAKAAELFPNVSYYKEGAKHGFLFLKNVMWDKQYGGFYTYVDRQGNVKPSNFAPKEAYGNSFAIYGLSAYYQVSGDTSALNLAIAGFRWLEKHSHDPVYKGYFQHMQRDGTPIKRTASTPTTAETGYKDQNTSIHLLEAFNELYTVWPDKLLRGRLNEMLLLIRDTIVTPKGYLNLFFHDDWTPVSYRDSSEAVILKHRGLNHVSFGHDVETAYLMLEAANTLGMKDDPLTLKIGKKMLDHAIDNGYDNQVGGFYDEGYYFKDKPGMTIIADTKNWWAQAEGLNTLLIMDKYYPHDPHHYFDRFKQLWTYVQTYLIDPVYGDWYQGGIDKQPEYKTALKGQIWKGTYHNFRALMNCVQSLHPDDLPPSAPVNLKVKKTGHSDIVTWYSAKGNKTFIGYNIYAGGKRVWYTALPTFDAPAALKGKTLKITAVDMHGNESKLSAGVAL